MAVITYKVSGLEIDQQQIIDAIAVKAEARLAELGERVAKVASARAPVGRDTPTSARSFQAVKLVNSNAVPRGRPGSIQRQRRELFEQLEQAGGTGRKRLLKAAGGSTRDQGILQFFRGTRAGGTVKQHPTQLSVKGNTIVGAFQHQPGRLKRSIKLVGVERRGNRVVATVRANVPYAMAVHEGFKHKGGWLKKTGKETKVAGQPFLRNALVNIQSDLNNPSAFEG